MQPGSITLTFGYGLILFSHGLLFLNYCSCNFVPERYLPPSLYLPPTCPPFHLYHIPTQKCYKKGYQEPCGEKMLFVEAFPSNKNSRIGECLCRDYWEGDNFWNRPMALWPDTKQCYFVYDQGPCPAGQWLVSVRGVGSCERIPCQKQYLAQRYSKSGRSLGDSKFLFSYGGKCYMTLSQGFCPSGKLAVFTNASFEPQCLTRDPNPPPPTFGKGSSNSCPEGKVLINNNCESVSNI